MRTRRDTLDGHQVCGPRCMDAAGIAATAAEKSKDMAMTQRDLLMKAFEFRHACRAFDPHKQVHDGDVGYVLEARRVLSS